MYTPEIEGPVNVVKVGTSTLTHRWSSGEIEGLNNSAFESIGDQVAVMKYPVIVSSAAIAAGMLEAGIQTRPSKETELSSLQRLAAIGNKNIVNKWDEVTRGRIIGNLLLTLHEMDSPPERNEAVKSILTMLSYGDIPVINENDAIATEEIIYGDNDFLAAEVAVLIKQRVEKVNLFLLTDVDGVHEIENDHTSKIDLIENISDHEHVAGHSDNREGSKGMESKLAAASIAQNAGITTYIANGQTPDVLKQAYLGKAGTKVLAS